ncbi:MAG: DNA polymerase I [bacterium]|nr:DNA polymerase I [bacterium]
MTHPLILIDGMSLVFRAYHALSKTGMASPSGEPSFAVFAFANILLHLLERHAPEAIAVVFDTPHPTFRHLMYDKYKANRDAFPDDLVPQLARIKSMIGLLGMECVEMPGFEADDVIGTIAKRESADGHDVLCVTSDKDYFQLVNDKVLVLRPGRDVGVYDMYDAVRVKEKFGVGPQHVVDVLALIGDASDNVPGVKGVGEKTAIPLIEKYGSVENLYDNLHEIERESLRTKFEVSRDMAFLSKKLVTMDLDVPVDAKRVRLVRKQVDYPSLDAFCGELGFHTLRKRFNVMYGGGASLPADGANSAGGSTVNADGSIDFGAAENAADGPPLQTVNDVEHTYTLVHTLGGLDDMVKGLKGSSILSVDLETTSLDCMSCHVVGASLSNAEGTAFFIAVDDSDADPSSTLFDTDHRTDKELLPIADVVRALKPLLEDPLTGKIGQNIKFDALILKRYGIDVAPIAFDTMLASYLLDADKTHGLDALSARWLNYKPVPITALIGEKKSQQRSMREVDLAQLTEYAAEDADVALKLSNILRPKLEENNLIDLAQNVEFPLVPVLVTMEFNGVRIEPSALSDLGDFMRTEAARLEKEIWAEAGQEFNIASNKQLGEVLFEKLMLPTSKKTKTGFSTDSSVLTELSEAFPIAQLILDYRQVEKLRSTYVESLPKLIHPRTQRVHTTYNQTVAATGRLSSTDPNLQNIPIRSELGLRIRKAFVPQSPDAKIFSADYSQIELRIMAAISQDPNLVAAFKSGEDIHTATAAILFDVPIASVTPDFRRVAKTVNFGIMYGLGAFGLAQRLGIPRAEGAQIIENYFTKYAGIKQYMEETIAVTRQRGYAATLLGRRRFFPLINSANRGLRTAAERACINMPIQGSAADMLKVAMIRIHADMKNRNMRSLMMLQVHDELVFEVYNDEVEELTALVKEGMEQAMPLNNVPVVVDTGIGISWYEAH